MAPPRRLTKTKYVCGLQCYRRLWWTVHEPGAPELVPDAAKQAVFDQGSRVGEQAREHVPGGVLIDVPYTQPTKRVETTRRALADGAPVIYEAAFFEDGIFVACDILSRRPRGKVTLTEVKSSTKVKPEHLPDAAVQAHVVRRAGLPVERVELMHLNRECAYPDLSNLFAREDVTADVDELVAAVPREAGRQLAMLAGELPDVEPGDQCRSPYECEFLERCWAPLPQHHVSELYKLSKSRLGELTSAGYETIDELPGDLALSEIQERQRRAVSQRSLVLEPGLGAALAALAAPVAYLDFETVMLPIPLWDGCHPYDQVPAQASVHTAGVDGSVAAAGWVADGPADPRPACAHFVAKALAGAATIVAYNAPFEAGCLQTLAAAATSAKERRLLLAAAERIADLLPLIRAHVYHPDFHGSFSLKRVLPALVPALGYDGLDIADGQSASLELVRLMLDEALGDKERQQVRAQLMAYCGRDTEGLVEMVRVLLEGGARGTRPVHPGRRARRQKAVGRG